MHSTRILKVSASFGALLLGACAFEPGEPLDSAVESALTVDTAPAYAIRALQSGKCLQIVGGSTANAARVEIAACNGSNAQKFKVQSVTGERYSIRNVGSNRCLDVMSSSQADGAEIVQYDCHGNTNQQFTFSSSSGALRMTAQHSGKVLDVVGRRTADGTRVVQYSWNDQDNQRFTLVASGSTAPTPTPTPTPTAPATTTGNGGVVNATILVKAGQVYDGASKRFIAGSALGDGSQSEGQKPVFRLEDGATLRNVVLGAPAADGIHTYGNVNLQNIVWEDIGEDALTIKASGTVTLNGGSAVNGDDKVFQVNAASTFRISNFRARDAGKFIRQNGGTTYKVAVFIDRCDISNMDEAVFRTDSSTSTVSMTNTRYSNIGDALFIGVSSGNITTAGNTAY